ncbi:MAG: GFA family protein [Pseudomonadota bacterium]
MARTELNGFSGHCYCGAVSYVVDAGPAEQILCHCDDCRRATGAAVAGFVSVEVKALHWTGTPAVHRSSDVAERGFCATCGTSLFYQGIGRPTIALTAGTADLDFAPVLAFFADAKPDWLDSAHSLPGET